MAIVAADWSVTRSNGNIRYIGDDHGGASPSYATVIEFHRWLQDLADDATSAGDDELDVTDINPSSRSTDNIIKLLGSYNIDDTAAEHLYDGSVIQGTGGSEVIYDGIVNFGNSDVQIQIIQNGAVLADDWWNFSGAGLNADASQGISHRFMIKTRTAGADIDGRRLIGTCRRYGKTFSEFKINGTGRGNNVLALSDATDLNNATVIGTVDGWTDVHIDRADSTTTVNGVNSAGQAVLNVVDGTQFAAGDFIQIAGFNQEYQISSIATNALTLTRNLVDATAGGEIVYDLNIGFSQIDVDNNAANEDYYAHWDRGAQTINGFYEYTKNITADATDHYVYGISGELFRGITHEIVVDTPTGTFAPAESVSWTGGTGQMLAINSPTAGTKMWIQLLTGVAPTDNQTITGGITSATVDVNVTVTDREALISKPFSGQSTGSALIGSYGLALQTTDLSASDKMFDLTNAQITPPNNVTFTVNGLVNTEDNVIVGPWDGVATDAEGNPAIDTDQLTLNTSLTTDNITSVVVTASIPSDTPATGYIRVQDDSGFYRRLHYSSWTGSTFTVDSTDGQEDFLTVNATNPRNVWISYIDKVAAGTSENFSVVYNSNRDLVVKVRDGGGTPIKEFITSAVIGSNGGSVTAIRTSDA